MFSASSTAGRLVGSRTVSDATIGLADGLTVPFALTAGLSTLGDARVVLYAGMAELIAGAISMGLGGYIAGRGEADAHNSNLSATSWLVQADRGHVEALIHSAFDEYDLPPRITEQFAAHITSLPEDVQTDFLMRFCSSEEGGPADTTEDRAVTSAVTIALGYFFGGLCPLLPYAIFSTVQLAFVWSVSVMVVALFVFGAGKTWLLQQNSRAEHLHQIARANSDDVMNDFQEKPRQAVPLRDGLTRKCVKGGAEMLVLGALAAAAAMGFIKLLT